MTRRTLDLSTLPWQFGPVERQPFTAQPADDRAAAAEWLPARVPGDVRADLIAAGRIPPLDTPEGIAAGAWIDDRDWWYRVTLPGGLAPDEVAILEADGIDFYSAIWLDDRLLSTHAGMFSRQTAVLTPTLNAPGPHELAIRIWGAGALPRGANRPWRRAIRWLLGKVSPAAEYFPDRLLTPKAQFSFGWDFAPQVLSTGIWDEIRLVVARGAYVEDLWVEAEPVVGEGEQRGGGAGARRSRGAEEKGSGGEAETVMARFRMHLRLRRWRARPLRVDVSIVRAHDASLATDVTLSYSSHRGNVRPERQLSYVMLNGSTIQDTLQRTTSEASPQWEFPAGVTEEDLALECDLPAARLWWPWDQGEPCLYRVTVRLVGDDSVLDEVSRVVGVRSVRREPLPEGNGWRFVINGRPVFLRGANWAPADLLPGRVTQADYERLLAQARSAGINFLRVWGGGVREKRSFWETCDRLGIMAWQEFPLACTFLDHYPRDGTGSEDWTRTSADERGQFRFSALVRARPRPHPITSGDASSYLALLASEARGMIRALRNHPSLIAWCGGNEINPGRERLPLAAIQNVLAEEDPDRPWLPASPAAGDVHRWDVWHGFAPWTALQHETAGLVSEFGLQALPDPATVAEMFPDGNPTGLTDPRWAGRKAQVAKLLHYAGPEAASPLDRAIAATQRAQAAGLQAGIEACRLRRTTENGTRMNADGRERLPEDSFRACPRSSASHSLPGCAGVVFWQFSEPWPAVSWAVIDRAGRPKAAYAMLQRCFQPVLIAARFPWRRYAVGDTFAAEIWLVNDGPLARAGCRAEAALDGQAVWAEEGIALPAAGSVQAGELTVKLEAAPRALALRLLCAGEVLATNIYDLAVHLPGRQPLRPRILQWIAELLLMSR